MREYNDEGDALLTDEEAAERYMDEWYGTDYEDGPINEGEDE